MQTLEITKPMQVKGIPLSSIRKYDQHVKAIQEMLKKNGVKMSAIEIRELMRTNGLSADENKIKAYVRMLRKGY